MDYRNAIGIAGSGATTASLIAGGAAMSIAHTVERFLEDHQVAYEVVQHPRSLSSTRTAASAHVPGDRLAKTILLEDDGEYLVAVVPATHRLDLGKLHHRFHRFVGLAVDQEVNEVFKDCAAGAVPPVGAAYGIKTLVDDSLIEQPDVYFEAGDHEALIHVTIDQFNKLMAGAEHGHFSYHV
jgi:Ala-tRNA(Pro) deacylase